MLPPLDDSLAALRHSAMYLSSRLVIFDAGQHSQPSLCFQQVCMSDLPFYDARCDDQQGLVLWGTGEKDGCRVTLPPETDTQYGRCARPNLLTPYIGCQSAPHLSIYCLLLGALSNQPSHLPLTHFGIDMLLVSSAHLTANSHSSLDPTSSTNIRPLHNPNTDNVQSQRGTNYFVFGIL